MNRIFLFCLSCLVFLSLKSVAQVGVGTTTPDASAQLEIKSATKGLLIPRVNSTGDVTSPANGLLVYQTGGTSGFYYNSGSAGSPVWLLLSTNSSTTPTGSAGGDLTGTYPSPTLASGVITSAKVADGAITLAKVNASGALSGQVLTYNGTTLVWSSPQSTVADGSIDNAKLAVNSVTTSRVVNGTITTSKMADSCTSDLKILSYAVRTKHIAKQAITTDRINTTGASAGQALTFNGTNVVWGAPQATATVADGSITNTQISPSASIAYSKLSLTNSIQNSDVTANAITTSKVANGTITTSKMADSCVSGLKLLSFAVMTKHVAKQAITTDKLNFSGASAGQVLTYNGTNVVWATPTGGTSSASYGYGTNSTSSTIAVVLGGTNIPVPNNQIFQNVTVDGANTTFTVATSGTYRINYAINLTSSVLASSRLLLNGTSVAASTIVPSQARNSYTAETILNLSAGDVLNVQLYGILGAVTLTSGQGAALTIQQLR